MPAISQACDQSPNMVSILTELLEMISRKFVLIEQMKGCVRTSVLIFDHLEQHIQVKLETRKAKLCARIRYVLSYLPMK